MPVAGGHEAAARWRMQGGTSPGAPKGNQYGFKHGRRSVAAIAVRQQRRLLRAMRELIKDAAQALAV